MEKLVLYTTHCPKCSILEEKLAAAGVNYTECTDIEKMRSLGIETVPVLEVNGDLLGFREANTYINEVLRCK